MVSDSQLCYYRQCLNPNENFYVEVRNNSPVYINFILGYTIHDKRVMKPSATFAPGKVECIVFPENAQMLCLRILNSSRNPPTIICSKFPSTGVISRYNVIKTPQGAFQCTDM